MPHISHRKITKELPAKYKAMVQDPRFIARLAKTNSTPINYKYDIPYLGGYSEDGKRVYIDRHLNVMYNGTDVSKFIRIHEVTEKAALDIFGLEYQQAHRIANHFERQAVEKANIDWLKYCYYLDPYIKDVSHEHLTNVPKDLDLTPYKDEKDFKLLSNLKNKIVRESRRSISLNYGDGTSPIRTSSNK